MLELLRVGLLELAEKPEQLLDAEYDMFAPLAATVPAYAAYLRELEGATALAVDGKTRVSAVAAVRNEIYDPTDEDNMMSTEKALEHIKAFAAGMHKTLINGQGARYVDGGEYSKEKQFVEMPEAFEGTDRNTSACESYFGSLKYYDQLYHAGVHNANAVVAAQRNHVYGSRARKYMVKGTRRKVTPGASMQKKRKREEEAEEGRLQELGFEMESVIMDLARGDGAAGIRKRAREDKAAADAAVNARRKEKKKEMLDKLTKCYVKAEDAFAAVPIVDNKALGGRSSLATLTKRADAALEREPTPAAQFALLKTELQRLTLGMGFKELAPKFYTSGVDATIGEAGTAVNIAFLRNTLIEAYRHIKEEKCELPEEAVVPEMHQRARSMPTLGGMTKQRAKLESEQRSATELRADADAFRARQRAKKSSPKAGSGSSARAALPEINDALARDKRRVEVVFDLTYKRRGGGEYVTSRWCPGTITDVSTESSVDESGGKRRKLGLGWLFIEYDDGAGGWLLATRPSFYRAAKPGGWRFLGDNLDVDDDEEDSADEEELESAPSDDEMSDGDDDDDL